jgi:hypothetical protein
VPLRIGGSPSHEVLPAVGRGIDVVAIALAAGHVEVALHVRRHRRVGHRLEVLGRCGLRVAALAVVLGDEELDLDDAAVERRLGGGRARRGGDEREG